MSSKNSKVKSNVLQNMHSFGNFGLLINQKLVSKMHIEYKDQILSDVLCQQNPKVRSINKIQVLHNNFELYFSELISISQNTIVFITNKGKM